MSLFDALRFTSPAPPPYTPPITAAEILNRMAILQQQMPPLPLHQLLGGAFPTPVSPPKELPKSFVAGPLLGYRSWKMLIGSGFLCSTGVSGQWLQLPRAANCHYQTDPAPHAGHSCGYYVLREIPKNPLGEIVGQVAFWGKVIKHTDGYRAQYAWPLRVWIPGLPPGFILPEAVQAELLAYQRNYGCQIGEV